MDKMHIGETELTLEFNSKKDKQGARVAGMEALMQRCIDLCDSAALLKEKLERTKKDIKELAAAIGNEGIEVDTLRFLSNTERSVDVTWSDSIKKLTKDLNEQAAMLPDEVRAKLFIEKVAVERTPVPDITEALADMHDKVDKDLLDKLYKHLEPSLSVKIAANSKLPYAK